VIVGQWAAAVPGSLHNFRGVIDELSLYNRALADSEIAAIFNASDAGKCRPTATVAPSGQVLWLTGDGNTNDLSGLNTGAFVGGSSFGIGKVGQSFNFDGTQSVTVADSAALDFTNAFTMEMWVAPKSAGAVTGQTFFVAKGNMNFANTQSYGVLFDINRRVVNRVGNGSTIDQLDSPTQIPLNALTHIATTYDGTTLRVYINGVLDSSKATTIGTLLNSSQPLVVGGAEFNGSILNTPAAIDEVSLYNRPLTADEIFVIFRAGAAGKLKQSTSTGVSTTVGDVTVTYGGAATRRIQEISLVGSQPTNEAIRLPTLPENTGAVGLFYDVATDANPAGDTDLCFNLPSFNNPTQFAGLRVLHLEANIWQDRTTTNAFASRQLCVRTQALSTFAIVNSNFQMTFSSNRDKSWGIYRMNADGTGVTKLTSGGEGNPRLSSDRTKIVYTGLGNGHGEIYTMNADGTGVTRVTNDSVDDYQPTWSPDGSKIAFTSTRDGNQEIYVINANGTGLTRLTNDSGGDFQPAWSPNGASIAFVSCRNNNCDVYTMSPDGTNLRRVTYHPSNDYDPSWSPDGNKLAFSSSRDGRSRVYVTGMQLIGWTRVTDGPGHDTQPFWGSNGRIVFRASRNNAGELYSVNANGTDLKRLTNNSFFEISPNW